GRPAAKRLAVATPNRVSSGGGEGEGVARGSKTGENGGETGRGLKRLFLGSWVVSSQKHFCPDGRKSPSWPGCALGMFRWSKSERLCRRSGCSRTPMRPA